MSLYEILSGAPGSYRVLVNSHPIVILFKNSSSFIPYLVKIFKEYAEARLDIRDMLDLVSIEVSNMETSNGSTKQTIEIINRGFYKVRWFSVIYYKHKYSTEL